MVLCASTTSSRAGSTTRSCLFHIIYYFWLGGRRPRQGYNNILLNHLFRPGRFLPRIVAGGGAEVKRQAPCPPSTARLRLVRGSSVGSKPLRELQHMDKCMSLADTIRPRHRKTPFSHNRLNEETHDKADTPTNTLHNTSFLG